jgi:hypothetical protein
MRHGQCWRAVEAALHARKICEAADVTINAALAKYIAQEMRLRDAIVAEAPYMRSGIQSIVTAFGRWTATYVARDSGQEI